MASKESAEENFISCLEELLDMPAASVEKLADNKCKVFLDGVGEFELIINCKEDLRDC